MHILPQVLGRVETLPTTEVVSHIVDPSAKHREGILLGISKYFPWGGLVKENTQKCS